MVGGLVARVERGESLEGGLLTSRMVLDAMWHSLKIIQADIAKSRKGIYASHEKIYRGGGRAGGGRMGSAATLNARVKNFQADVEDEWRTYVTLTSWVEWQIVRWSEGENVSLASVVTFWVENVDMTLIDYPSQIW